MRFGHFFYPMTLDTGDDGQAIDDCIYETELVENLGLDAIWLAEHHFIGEVAYGDPMVFAGVVAAHTKRVDIGFGIIEMALHHPVRLAVQTALLDHLTRGRLIVGTGRGSNFNAFEYTGFGSTVDAGPEMLNEAEDLLLKAWTTENVDHKGTYWQASFPSIRPRPYQKPHPRLARACINLDSVVEMARIGRPILMSNRSTSAAAHALALYRDTMVESGFSEEQVEQTMDQVWIWRECYLAESDDQAFEEWLGPFERASEYVAEKRVSLKPPDVYVPTPPPPLSKESYGEVPNPDANELFVGSPKRVSELIAMLRDVGGRNLMLTHRGLPNRQQSTKYLKLLSEKVMPLFR